MSMYIYIYIYVCTYVYIYIYIYIRLPHHRPCVQSVFTSHNICYNNGNNKSSDNNEKYQ